MGVEDKFLTTIQQQQPFVKRFLIPLYNIRQHTNFPLVSEEPPRAWDTAVMPLPRVNVPLAVSRVPQKYQKKKKKVEWKPCRSSSSSSSTKHSFQTTVSRWSQTLPPFMFTARVATDLLIHDSKVFIPCFPCKSTEYTERSLQELVDPGASEQFHSLLFSWKDALAASVGAGHEKKQLFFSSPAVN